MTKVEAYTISKIASLIAKETILVDTDVIIKSLEIDTRTLADVEHSLFFAIKGARDGHHFIDDAYANGIRNFVVSNKANLAKYAEANFIIVNDTLEALQKLAAYHRNLFNFDVIGITGSNGKTIVKEWLNQLLAADYVIVRSPKSYNSQIGVPLSVWQMAAHHTLGIFEAGISTINEMGNLEEVIRPTIGILTNIKDAHNNGFVGKDQKLTEKLKLFKDVKLLICAAEDISAVAELLNAKRFTWSFKIAADLQVLTVRSDGSDSIIEALYDGNKTSCKVPFTDAAAIENVVICWASLLALNFENEVIIARLAGLQGVGMRLQLLNGIDNCSVIDDSYSADISSLAIALDFLNKQNQHPKRTLILSDLQETGKEDAELYQAIAVLLQQKKIDRLIGVGEKITSFADLFGSSATFFSDTASLMAGVGSLHFSNETILIKGARKFEFERVVKRLAQKVHDTVLEINLNALVSNLQFYTAKLSPGVKRMAMVKAFSYGSGSFEIANLLQYHKVDYLAVAFADEGIALRKAGITLPIMVMSPEPSAFDAMVRFKLEPEIYSISIFTAFLQFLGADVVNFPIHLKLDTGMHRLGFEPHQVGELKQLLKKTDKVKISSVFTHLVGSDEAIYDEFTERQIALYQQMYNEILLAISYKPLRHVLNTSGISRWNKYEFDMVRIGIGLYGFDGALKSGTDGLQTVAVLKTTISQIKEIPVGETVGYSRRGILENGGKTATVKIGYADGYSRAFGNGIGKMLVNGKLAPTVGSICMDMCMLDVTGVDVNVGDEVIVFNQQHTINDLAKAINTIPYEILTNVSQRVKRIYSYE